ncbi:MAG: hypothetical protein ACK58T_26545, partial [Phycisphaerae bacterium]
MSAAANPTATLTSAPRPAGPTPSSAPVGAGGVAIDPVKLLMKYKYILGGAGGLGLVIGVV